MINAYSSFRTITIHKFFNTPISSLDDSNNFFSGLNARARPTAAYILDSSFSNQALSGEMLLKYSIPRTAPSSGAAYQQNGTAFPAVPRMNADTILPPGGILA